MVSTCMAPEICTISLLSGLIDVYGAGKKINKSRILQSQLGSQAIYKNNIK